MGMNFSRSHVKHAKGIKTIKDFFEAIRKYPMTIDGLILENLIRQLISTEFKDMHHQTETNTVEIDRLKSIVQIETQKLGDTSSRLKRLQDDHIRKELNDKQFMAKKTEVDDVKEE